MHITASLITARVFAAEFPSKGFVHGFRKFAKLAKTAIVLLVLKGLADGLVSRPKRPNSFTTTAATSSWHIMRDVLPHFSKLSVEVQARMRTHLEHLRFDPYLHGADRNEASTSHSKVPT